MSHNFLFDASFFSLLMQIDEDLSKKMKKSKCTKCKGRLHRSPYPRNPHGVPAKFREQYGQRLSHCCADCRKLSTPPSVRFFGRRWFVAPVFMLICALKNGANKRRAEQIYRHFGVRVSASTWKRWQYWWRYYFEKTKYWNLHKGLLAIPIENNKSIPRELLSKIKWKSSKKIVLKVSEKIVLLLRFLSQLTSGFFRGT